MAESSGGEVNGKIRVGVEVVGGQKAAQELAKFERAAETTTDQVINDLNKIGNNPGLANLGNSAGKAADKVEAAGKRISRYSAEATKEIENQAKARAKATEGTIGTRTSASVEEARKRASSTRGTIQVRKLAGIELQESKSYTKMLEGEERRRTLDLNHNLNRRLVDYRSFVRQRDQIDREGRRLEAKSGNNVSSVLDRAMGLSPEVRSKIEGALTGAQANRRLNAAQGFGLTKTEAFHNELSNVFSQDESSFLVGQGRKPVSFGGKDIDAANQLREQKTLGSEMNAMINRNAKDQAKAESENNRAAKQSANEQAGYWLRVYKERASGEKDVAKSAQNAANEQAGYWLRVYKERAAGERELVKAQKQADSEQMRSGIEQNAFINKSSAFEARQARETAKIQKQADSEQMRSAVEQNAFINKSAAYETRQARETAKIQKQADSEQMRSAVEQNAFINKSAAYETRQAREVARAEKQADAEQMRAGIEQNAFTNKSIAFKIKGEKEVAKAEKQADSEQMKSAIELNAYYNKSNSFRANQEKSLASIAKSEAKEVEKVIGRSLQGSAELQEKIRSILNAPGAGVARSGMRNVGLLPQQALSTQLQAGGIEKQIADFVSGIGGTKRPTALGGTQVSAAGGKGGGGFFGGIGRRLLGGGGGGVAGSLIGGLASGIGIGVGGYALANLTRATVESAQAAQAYERQRVAAAGLAGGQEQLNKLLEEYNKASGGAVSKTDQLQAVTRLLATGFAKTAKEVASFTRGSRGASIALGRPQEEVTQDIQLAISNTSVKRLDQIGLGIKEVNDKIKELRKTNASWTRETAFGEAVLTLLDQKYGKLSQTVEGQATGIEKLAAAWDNLGLAIGKATKGPIGTIFANLAKGVDELTEALDRAEKNAKVNDFLEKYNKSQGISGGFGTTRAVSSMLPVGLDLPGAGGPAAISLLMQSLMGSKSGKGLTPQQAAMIVNPVNLAGELHGNKTVRPPTGRSDEQMSVLRSAYDQRQQMEKAHQEAITNEVNSYQESRESSIRNYNKSVAREEEDFYRQRARGLRDYEKSVVDLMRDAQDRESEAQEDLDKNIAEMREDSDKKLAKSEKDFNEETERNERDHRLKMLMAAGQLDAVALLNERLSYNKEKKERQKQHDEAIKEDKDSLAERIQDAIEANDERLDDARKADAKRLADMAADRKQQLSDEDEDRAIANGRAKEDHDDELAEMDRQHGLRMDQIAKEYADEQKAFNDALEADLLAVGIYVDGYTDKLKKRDDAIEKWFDKYIDKVEKLTLAENKPKVGANNNPLGPAIPEYAHGGYVPRSGLAMLHAGEFVMPRSQVAAAVNNYAGGNSKSVQVHPGAFQVYTTPGMEMAVGQQIEEILIRILEAA